MNFDETDPTADFLAREQAILGQDAALFGNSFISSPAVATGMSPVSNVPPVPDSFENDLFMGQTSPFVLP